MSSCFGKKGDTSMFGEDKAVYSLLVTLDDYSQLPQIHLPYREGDAGTWYSFLQGHPHVLAVQLLKDGQRQDGFIWTREGLSALDILKALGM
jgi:hypothetical protein